ncbi:STAS domain-containing protein [Geomesophilobacter sediminis]|uniref:STAS domain-containing protein n=1 Tax=Geomesophilobacter sediminis TaxID=2798584 RepID=A0A8J7JM70_9BACT|nr:STAS domain-containing protein [Geomesophilobacter sediminis]MBJ6725570.1 STAS domain-containing protein [Geomesophilobacter sediminis]
MLTCTFAPTDPERGDGEATLHLKGRATIETCTEFRDALRAALTGCRNLTIDVSEVEAIDLSCIQLFCSAHKTALNQGKNVTIANPQGEEFTASIRNVGLTCTLPGTCQGDPDHFCLWGNPEAICRREP